MEGDEIPVNVLKKIAEKRYTIMHFQNVEKHSDHTYVFAASRSTALELTALHVESLPVVICDTTPSMT
jgi:hypothetical protein